MDEDALYVGEFIIGMLDDDGYLRIDMQTLVAEINRVREEEYEDAFDEWKLRRAAATEKGEQFETPAPAPPRTINLEKVELVLAHIRRLDPPGIAARSIQECLLAQLEAAPKPTEAHKRAIQILTKGLRRLRDESMIR